MQNTGFVLPGFPSFGAWVSYGLGSLNDDLPTFVVLPDSRGFAPNGPANWAAGFLPAAYQGTMVKAASKNPIFDLFPPDDPVAHRRRASATGWRCSNSSTGAQASGARRTRDSMRGSPPTSWRPGCN